MLLLSSLSRRVRLTAVGCCVAFVLVVGICRADEEAVHLRYRAVGPCAGRDAFVAQVAARTPRARWIARDEAVRIFEVTVEADPEQGERWSQAAGTLSIIDTDGSIATRRVEGDSCDDVLSAMALITALAIDPQAKLEPVADAGPTTASVWPPVAGPPSTPSPQLPLPTPAAPPAPSSTTPPPSPPPTVTWSAPGGASPSLPPGWTPPPDRPPAAPSRWRWASGVSPVAASGLGSALRFVLPIYLDLSLDAEDGVVVPSFRVAVSYLPNQTIEHVAGSAEFLRVAAHPSGCPLRLQLYQKVVLRPCVGAEIGMLRGSGKLAPQRSEASLWLAAVAPVRLQWTPLDWVLLEIQGEFGVPIIRQRFYFEPDRTIVAVDPVFGTVGGGAGVRFP